MRDDFIFLAEFRRVILENVRHFKIVLLSHCPNLGLLPTVGTISLCSSMSFCNIARRKIVVGPKEAFDVLESCRSSPGK